MFYPIPFGYSCIYNQAKHSSDYVYLLQMQFTMLTGSVKASVPTVL